MAPKHAPAKISEISLTNDEIEAARKILQAADTKKMNSLKQGLKAFLTANPDEKVNKDNKYSEEFLMKFVSHQSRCAEAQKKVCAKKTVERVNAKMTDVIRMGVEKMNTELGTEKAKLWRTVLKPMPDSLTGRTDPEYLEYAVPVHWERMTQAELKQFVLETSGDASREDVEAASLVQGPDMELLGAASSSTGIDPVTVKVEPADAKEQEKAALLKRAAELKENLPSLCRDFQDKLLDAKLIMTKAKARADQYHVEFRSDLESFVKKLTSTKNILERMHSEDANPAEIPKLLSQMETMKNKYKQVEEFAMKNGYKEETKKGKRKRATAA